MERKIVKKILAILMIVIILSADFFVLGSSLVTYAMSLDSSTNHNNIEFVAYFKDENGNKIDALETSVMSENLRLYADIKVKNDGYFNGILELVNSNFSIKNNILSDSIASIEGNKVTLKQINAGTTAQVELDIEPIILDTLNSEMLLSTSDLKLAGTYMETSYKGLNIEATKNVKLNLQADASAQAELETNIVTNKVFSINGENKRVVQLLVKSRLTDNQYPIKQTKINVNVPILSEKQPEEVAVLSLGTMATNGETTLAAEDWKNENGTIQITLKNEDSEIKWNKDVYDELIVTFIYAEDVDANIVEITTNSEIAVHNSETTYTAQYVKGIENQELNGIITVSTKVNSEDIYKGQLYANVNSTVKKEIEYRTTSTLVITNADIAEKVAINEGLDVFVTDTEELVANTKYVSTEINKAKMLELLGQDGNIEIKNGTNTILLNKDTETNESGNIVINYENGTNELIVSTSKIENAGLLEMNHTKAITENAYSMEQLKTIKAIKTKASVKGIVTVEKVEENVVENSTESSLELKETISKAELTIDRESLSTITTNEDVILGVKLITDGLQYDLYKNPRIQIQLPSSVESAKIDGTPNKLYADNFTIDAQYNNETRILDIVLKGTQIEYPESAAQIYLQINMDITLSKLVPSQTDKIVMTYTNENATQYDGGTTNAGMIEKNIEISSPNGLITMHNTDTYDITGIAGTSEEKQLVKLANEDAGKEVSFDMALVNNTGSDLSNVRILGKLPTEGNKVSGEENANTLATTLKEVIASNATIYYTNNNNATSDIADTNNGWTTEFSENARMYLIVIETLNVQSNYNASYTIVLPTPMPKEVNAYAEYTVIYDTEIESDVEANSVIIGFVTEAAVKMETKMVAQVGNDILNNGDTVKVGEVIKYTMSVKNNGIEALQNVQLKGLVPEGTVVVEPEENAIYSGASYYEEKADITSKIVTISALEVGQTYSETYEVRVKEVKDNIANKANVICEDTVIDSDTIENKIEEASIRVTIKNTVNDSRQTAALETTRYLLFIENLTDKVVKDLNVEIEQEGIEDIYLINSAEETISDLNAIQINEIPANGLEYFNIYGIVSSDVTENIKINANIIDKEGKTYKSNEVVQNVTPIGATVTMSTPNNGEYVKENDTITYEIVVKNTGGIAKNMMLVDNISEYLVIEEIYENNVLKRQSINREDTETYFKKITNNFEYFIAPGIGEEVTIKIVARIKNIDEEYGTIRIANTAEVFILDQEIASSEEVFHILKYEETENNDNTGDNENAGGNGNTGDNENADGNENNGSEDNNGNNEEIVKNTITGFAWLDENQNGKKDGNEKLLSNIGVQLFDISENKIAKDDSGNNIETETNENGEYIFTDISSGEYILVFEYDTNKFELTTYKAQGVPESQNSNVVLKTITLDGIEYKRAVTDTIKIDKNISNINIGLKEKRIYDMELDKFISKIIVQNNKGTKQYDYNDSTFEKVEIHRKQINNSVVILEYTIKVKNAGELPGYVTNVKDYLPNGLEFSSELNPDWYLNGENLYTKALANDQIQPGETREIKLVLMKTMTENNVGVINNRAEIVETYNEYGKQDIDSIENNENQNEDDFGKADVIIGISTGAQRILYTILTIINTALIIIAIYLVFTKKIR